MKVGAFLPFVIDSLNRLIAIDCFVGKRTVLHLKPASFPNTHSCKQGNEDSGRFPV